MERKYRQSLTPHEGIDAATVRRARETNPPERMDELKQLAETSLPGVPFFRPYQTGKELDYVRQAILTDYLSGDGSFTARCHDLLERRLGVERALLTTSCTTALEMAAVLSRTVEPGAPAGEVIVPAYTFVSTANAFVLHGYTPVFADIHPDTCNLDETKVESLITPRTRAIVAVHYAGVPCEMEELEAIAQKNSLVLIEDAAQAIFSTYRGRYAGALGDLATFSFHGTKNLSCGEGGALTLRDERFVERAEFIREKGTNRKQFLRGHVDKYTWIDIGGSYLPSELLAAYLLAQLEGEERIHALRRERYERYIEGLAELQQGGWLTLPRIPEYVESNHHLFHCVVDGTDTRDRLIDFLRDEGISSVFHYSALHLSPMGVNFGPPKGALPVSERVAAGLLRLPLYPDLELADVDRVIDSVHRFFRG